MAETQTLIELDKSSEIYGISNNRYDDTASSRDTKPINRGYKKASKVRLGVTLAACFYIYLTTAGIHITLGVIYVELIAYFDSPRSEAALVQSVYAGTAFGGGIFFTNLLLKYDIGLVIMLASLITTVSFCASAFAPNIQVVIFLVSVIAGLASSISNLGALLVVSWTFHEQRKAAIAVLFMGAASGQIVLPYIATALIEQVFWNDTVIILGAFMFLNVFPCGIIVYYSTDYFQKGDATKLRDSKLVDVRCFTDTAFMGFLVSYFLLNATVSVEQWFIVDMAIDKGFSVESGAVLLSINGIMLVFSRIVAMVWLRLAPNIKLARHLSYIFILLGISHVTISQSPVYWAMVLGMVIRGFTGGLIYAFFPGLQIDMRGLELFPQTTAITNCVGGIGTILGGFVGGLSYDLTGSYDLIFTAAAGFNVYNAITMMLIILINKLRERRTRSYDTI